MHAVIEAVSSEKFLVDKDLVQKCLVEPFDLVQTNDPLVLNHHVPAITEFLVSDIAQLRNWSIRCLEHSKELISHDDFDFAFRGSLTRHLAKGSSYPIDLEFVSNLWHGLKLVVDRLDCDMITHSLRALEVNVYRLGLDHLQINTPGIRYIIQTLCKLLQISSKDFWDAMGAIGPTTVAEQVFKSPQFGQILRDAEEWEFNDSTTAAADMLAWVKPLIASLQIGQRPPVCRSVLSQLLYKLGNGNLSTGTQLACYKEGLDCLAYTLQTCNEGLNTTDTISHAVVIDALGVTGVYFRDILDIMVSSALDSKRIALEDACSFAVELALMLECKAINIASNMLKSPQKRTPIYLPVLWLDAGPRLRQGSTVLANAMLAAMESALSLEYAASQQSNTDFDDYNTTLDRLFQVITQSLEKISVFPVSDLRSLTKTKRTLRSLMTIIPAAEQSIHESAMDLIKAMTEEDFRKEALRRLLTFSLPDSLDGLSYAARRIAKAKSFGPCSIFLKVCTSVLDALCDPQDGLLRQSTFTTDGDLRAIKDFWDSSWQNLGMMYECSESYSMKKVATVDVLREFVRDVMQLSQTLFSQFAVFSNTTSPSSKSGRYHPVHSTSSPGRTGSTEELLLSPSGAMDGVAKFLRLKDEYLLRTSVQLVRMLLRALTKEDMILSPSTSDFLASIAIFNNEKEASKRIGTKTLLTPTEIAGIILDLEENLGRPLVQEARENAMLAKGLLPQDTSKEMNKSNRTGAIATVTSNQQKKKQGTINFETWNSQPSSLKGAEMHRSRTGDPLKSIKDETGVRLRPTPGLLDRKLASKQAQGQKTAAQQEAFLNERKRQKQEADARRAEQVAKIKKNLPTSIAGQTSGEGSALARIGVAGKDHAPKGESMMVSSDSESESDDDFDKELFGSAPKSKTTAAVTEFNASRAKLMRAQGPVKKTKIIRSAKDMRARLAPNMTGLWRRILSWDFFHDKDFPPDSTKDDYSLVTDLFRTAADYRRAFEALLLLEAWSSLQKSREEGGFRTFEVKISNRITVDALFEVSVSMDIPQCKTIGIFEADIIILSRAKRPTEDSNASRCLGRISRIRHKKGLSEITIQVAQTPQVHSWLIQNTLLYAARIDSIITLEREYGALVGLEWYDLCQEIISAQISPILKYADERLERIAKLYRLNKAQAKAVQSAIDNDAFTLIQGPPGSGKTKTIVAIVGALLTDTLRQTEAVTFSGPRGAAVGHTGASAAPKKLLVCAPSNAAVDELVMRFMDGVKSTNGTFQKPKVVRLGRSDRVNPQVLGVTLDELVEKRMNPSGSKATKESTDLEKAINSHKAVDRELKEMYAMFDEVLSSGNATTLEMSQRFEKLKRDKQSWSNQIERLRDSGNTASRDADIKKRQAEQQILGEAHIICATLSGSARESFQHLTIDFETVVVDEAAQCIELSALIPLKYGCSKCIMVGDPKQLPPTVLSRDAARFRYEQSLFVRMQKHQPKDVHLLDTQYRMHPDISRFPSMAFYDGKLLDGSNMANLRAQPWHEDKLLGPYRFYDVAGKHENAPKGHSLVNKSEVEVAIELYKRLKATVVGYDFRGKIGIITPYKSQLKLLSERFNHQFGPEIIKSIEFNTTDAFQGRESEIIIFSCVRASDRGIGFLSDIRRMNVGITRAKSSLWVLGNSESLIQGEYWRALIQDARGRGLCSEGSVMRLLKDSPQVKPKGNSNESFPNVNGHGSKNGDSTSPSGHEEITMFYDTADPSLSMPDPGMKQPSRKTSEHQGTKTELALHGGSKAESAPLFKKHTQELLISSEVREIPFKPFPGRDLGSSHSNTTRPIAVGHRSDEQGTREGTPIELKRKRSSSPQEVQRPSMRPPPVRKAKKDDDVFVRPRRKGR
ncbi:MAG: DEAD-box type RNA helicase [Stictis urceolatum]|nr:DEAD-box type RNA helicase [Stictis urceolata]